jgi:hypothetical protein
MYLLRRILRLKEALVQKRPLRSPHGILTVIRASYQWKDASLKASTEHRWLDSIRAPSSRKVRPTRHNSRSPASLEVTAAFAWIESS